MGGLCLGPRKRGAVYQWALALRRSKYEPILMRLLYTMYRTGTTTTYKVRACQPRRMRRQFLLLFTECGKNYCALLIILITTLARIMGMFCAAIDNNSRLHLQELSSHKNFFAEPPPLPGRCPWTLPCSTQSTYYSYRPYS